MKLRPRGNGSYAHTLSISVAKCTIVTVRCYSYSYFLFSHSRMRMHTHSTLLCTRIAHAHDTSASPITVLERIRSGDHSCDDRHWSSPIDHPSRHHHDSVAHSPNTRTQHSHSLSHSPRTYSHILDRTLVKRSSQLDPFTVVSNRLLTPQSVHLGTHCVITITLVASSSHTDVISSDTHSTSHHTR